MNFHIKHLLNFGKKSNGNNNTNVAQKDENTELQEQQYEAYLKKKEQQAEEYSPDVHDNEVGQELQHSRELQKATKYHHLSLWQDIKLLVTPSKINRRKVQANRSDLQKREDKALTRYCGALPWITHLLTRNELRLFYRMGVEPGMASQYVIMRILACVVSEIIPFVFLVIFHSPQIFWFMIVALPIMIWCMASWSTRITYHQYATQQSIRFDYLLSVMSPYLYSMNSSNNIESGASLSVNAVLTAVTNKLDDRRLQNIVSEWNINIRHDPTSFLPYQIFASKFLGSDLADNFARSVYHLAQGATDVSAIRHLNTNARTDFMTQIRYIAKRKIKRFTRLPPSLMLVDWLLLMFVFLILLLIANAKKAISLI